MADETPSKSPFASSAPPVPPELIAADPNKAKKEGDKNPFAEPLRKALRQRVLIGIGAGILVLLAILYYAFVAGKGGILVLDTSGDLTIQLNGQPVTGEHDSRGRFIPAYAGVYRLTLTRPTYQPLTLDVSLARGETVGVRPAYSLLPNSQQTPLSTIDYVHVAPDGKSILYLGNSGQTLYRFDISQGKQIPLTDQPLRGISDIEWSSDPTVALFVQDGTSFLHEIPKYDFRNQITVRVAGPEVIGPVWDPLDNTRIAAIYIPGTGEESLIFTDPHIARIERKADLTSIPELKNPKLVWAGGSDAYVAIINRSTDSQANNIWLYKTADGTLTQATSGGGVGDAKFSPDGSMLLYQTASNDAANPFHATLTVAKADGSNKLPLGVPGTVAQAAWKDNGSFYLPNPATANLELYTLDGKRTDVPYSLSNPVDIRGMIYFSDKKKLIFYTTQAIYTIDLGS